MKIFSFLIISILLVLFFISRKCELPDGLELSAFSIPFYKMGAFISDLIIGKKKGAYYKKLRETAGLLNPSGDSYSDVRQFLVEKLGLVFMLLTIGSVLIILVCIKDEHSSAIENGELIKRGDYNTAPEIISLDAQVDGVEIEDLEIKIDSRHYTVSQLDAMLSEFIEAAEQEFLGNNETLDCVNQDVVLAETIEGYPFETNFSWDDHSLIDHYGKLGTQIDSEGQVLEINLHYSLEDYEGNHSFFIRVYPSVYDNESMKNRLTYMLQNENENTKSDEYFSLPTLIDGMQIHWSEKKKNNALILGALILGAALFIFIGRDRDFYKEVEKRNNQMLEDYPDIVSKLTILAGAGMSMRMAWKKIACDYRDKNSDRSNEKRYAYEEMLFTLCEMESGVSEAVCYQRFSARCRVQKYVKMATVLEQSIKKGTDGVMEAMRTEAIDAFEERKSIAEKKGEEAATKLLIPMIMMLLVVMVTIMYPALVTM